ncbi:glycerophosphodiester phosphodiesterase [Zeaxanthinibacter sp. PT1]|uniref:glycerophosphodiester phosphodiesterase n=1 Tax=Zeaxanthinibacter TaxID=561554 RepID=UPI00234B4FA0|nr:glycerophosphodiester phosphodiesterase [Zeaxanthinibacter sp. PT1]MDC6351182.1 glycerophosphodiester phosphodiesterase [Zeaxanthinibacter sp. PT1]
MMIIGHRGAMGHETENSLASIEKAMELGVDMIEIDVFRIKSGEIMVFHDDRLERLTNGAGDIESYYFVELRRLDVEGGHKIPMLQEVLRTIDHKTKLNIELKGTNTAGRVNFIMENYIEKQGWKLEDFLISSFRWDELREMRKNNPDVDIAVLTDGDPEKAIEVARELNAVAINPHYKKLKDTNVKAIHDAGFKVLTWTVNEPEEIDRMRELGVDGIFTDFPERAR